MLIHTDSFDHYDTAHILRKYDSRITSGASIATIVTTMPRNGSRSLSLVHSGGSINRSCGIQKILPARATYIIGSGYRTAKLPDGGKLIEIFSFMNSSGYQCALEQSSDGYLHVYRGGNNAGLYTTKTLLGSSSIGFGQDVWRYLEFLLTISNTVGVAQVRVNGATVINLSAIDTLHVGNADITSVWLGSPINNYSTSGSPAEMEVDGECFMDDLYICDDQGSVNNTFLGDCRVEALLPTAAGTYSEWTRSAGAANYETVDETVPNDDTDYVSSSTVGHRDTYNYPAVQASSGVVRAVAVNTQARKDDGGVRTIAAMSRLSGTDLDGPNFNPGATYSNFQSIFETKPGGGSWSITNVNDAEYGPGKVIA